MKLMQKIVYLLAVFLVCVIEWDLYDQSGTHNSEMKIAEINYDSRRNTVGLRLEDISKNHSDVEHGTSRNKAPSQSDAGYHLPYELERRRRNAKHVCDTYNIGREINPASIYTHRLLVNDRFKFIFVYIPKVSCSTWKTVLHRILASYHDSPRGQNRLNKKHRLRLNRLQSYNESERVRILRDYKKVIFVREPLVRLLSAYLSKFRTTGKIRGIWDKTFGIDIVNGYRDGSTTSDSAQKLYSNNLQLDVHVTFDEFARYILNRTNATEITGLTDHWLPMNIVSHICYIQYDFIGKYENLSSEGPFLLQWLGVKSVKFPSVHPSKTDSLLKSEYKLVSKNIIERLASYYARDYELFDYDIGRFRSLMNINEN